MTGQAMTTEQKLREALQEAVRIASDENGEVFGGNLIARETAIVKWKQQAREALSQPPTSDEGVPDTKIDLSEDELMDVLKKTSPYMTEKQYKALTVTRWKDSIDVDYPNEAFRILAHFVLLAAAPQSGKKEDGSNG